MEGRIKKGRPYRFKLYVYRVPILKVQSYSLEEIEKKRLGILVPFLPLRFRKKKRRDPATGEK